MRFVNFLYSVEYFYLIFVHYVKQLLQFLSLNNKSESDVRIEKTWIIMEHILWKSVYLSDK
jgi:hypothetical protein